MRTVIKTTKEMKPDGTVIETREEIRDDYYWPHYPYIYTSSTAPTYTTST